MVQTVPAQSTNSNQHRGQLAAALNALINQINGIFGAPAGKAGPPSLAPHAVLVGEGTDAITPVTGASGKILASKGTNADPAFVAGASVQSALGSTSTSSTSGVMLGYGATIALTPTYSGKVLITFNGILGNNTAGAIGAVQIHYGTGTAPANGAAITGLAAGSVTGVINNANTAGFSAPLSVTALITGLVPGTAYWVDLSMICVGASTTSLLNVSASATEVP